MVVEAQEDPRQHDRTPRLAGAGSAIKMDVFSFSFSVCKNKMKCVRNVFENE